jgi:NTP pyrophosphatase (non-canonical NTP hydrolase)
MVRRMPKPPSSRLAPLRQVQEIMAALRAPDGCPWDREQDHQSLRWHAVEEVYELLDAIESGDEGEMVEELGDLLLQIVFHAQLGRERQAFDFDTVCRSLAAKLVRRHPHVFGEVTVRDIDQVWANWEQIKRAEKAGSIHERHSALDGVPRHLPALQRAQKLLKKARKAGLDPAPPSVQQSRTPTAGVSRKAMGQQLWELARLCQDRGWSAEELLRAEAGRQEQAWRRAEAQSGKGTPAAKVPTRKRKARP